MHGGLQRTGLLQDCQADRRVRPTAMIRVAFRLSGSGGNDAGLDDGGGFARRAFPQHGRGQCLHVHAEVDAVQDRFGQPCPVAVDGL